MSRGSITVCSAEQFQWAHDVISQLEAYGFHLKHISSIEERQIFDAGPLPDAIITMTPADSATLKQMLETHNSNGRTPLLLLVSNHPDVQDQAADSILPAEPNHISQQIDMLLKLRHENAVLRQEKHTADEQIKQMREDLKSQRRASDTIEVLKNAIVRNVSHELKTPLLQVKSAVALLAEDVSDEKLINYAKGATARLEMLVKNITMLGSSLEYTPSPVIVRDAAEYARRNLNRIWQQQADAERIKLILDSELPPVHADKQGLSTVLQLLLDNALKFSEKDVEVIAKRQGEQVYVAVKDYGIGIAREEIKKIFDTFYQVDGSSTRRYGGTGVGLAIVKIILDNHNARINVESVIGKGSTFSFLLPSIEIG